MLTIRQQVHVPEVTQHDATISKLLNSNEIKNIFLKLKHAKTYHVNLCSRTSDVSDTGTNNIICVLSITN